eukprot:contig_25425_g6272
MDAAVRPAAADGEAKTALLASIGRICRADFGAATVWMFGSSGSGLGLRGSDMDLCISVPASAARHPQSGSLLSRAGIIRRLAYTLRRGQMGAVEERLHARVPIVTFLHPRSRVSVDLCVNSSPLVRYNTELLATYAGLDKRVPPLARLVKAWARGRVINQPYRGTLSSYAYVLLLLFFLQTRPVPVVPCLQARAREVVLPDPLESGG